MAVKIATVAPWYLDRNLVKKSLFTIVLLLCAVSPEPLIAHASVNELISYTSNLVDNKPGNTKMLLHRARLHLKQGSTAHAFSDIEAAKRYSDHIEVAYLLGLYYVAVDRQQLAIDAFSTYLTRFPLYTPAIHARARANARLGFTESSIRDYQYLLSVSKLHSPDYYLEVARLESTLEPYGIYLALRSLDRGIENLGLLVSLQKEAIKFELLREDYSAALARHESLEPWLGKTQQWEMLRRELRDKSLAVGDLAGSSN